MLYSLAMLRHLVNSRYLVWMLLALPGFVTVLRYFNGDTYYGEIVHFTGELSARLLIVTMAVTPLRLMFPGRGWVAWLMQRRRYFGVATFGYAALHTGVYVSRTGVLADLLADAAQPGILTGWVAIAIYLLLALTSNERSVKLLRQVWKRLHRWVYAAAMLTFAHWLLVAFDIVPGLIHLFVLAALEGYRVWATRLARS